MKMIVLSTEDDSRPGAMSTSGEEKTFLSRSLVDRFGLLSRRIKKVSNRRIRKLLNCQIKKLLLPLNP